MFYGVYDYTYIYYIIGILDSFRVSIPNGLNSEVYEKVAKISQKNILKNLQNREKRRYFAPA